MNSYKVYPPGNNEWPGATAPMQVPLRLYNLSVDPRETVDVQSQHPDVVKQLEALADQYRYDLGDDLTHVQGTGRRPSVICEPCENNIRKP